MHTMVALQMQLQELWSAAQPREAGLTHENASAETGLPDLPLGHLDPESGLSEAPLDAFEPVTSPKSQRY